MTLALDKRRGGVNPTSALACRAALPYRNRDASPWLPPRGAGQPPLPHTLAGPRGGASFTPSARAVTLPQASSAGVERFKSPRSYIAKPCRPRRQAHMGGELAAAGRSDHLCFGLVMNVGGPPLRHLRT
jgi:hypothetical protein